MYQGTTANKRARQAIIAATFTLMKKQNLAKIPIKKITEQASVARATFYNNYHHKEDILRDFTDNLYDQITAKLGTANYDYFLSKNNCFRFLQRCFEIGLQNKERLLAMGEQGYATYLVDMFNDHVELLLGNMSVNSEQRYRLYFVSGAVGNLAMKWLKNGAKETPTEMARLVIQFFNTTFWQNTKK